MMADREERETRRFVLEVEKRQAWWKTGKKYRQGELF
jgi:hypothetical protein